MVVGEMEIRLRADIARLQRDMDSGRRVVGDATDRMGRAADAVKMAFAGMLAGMGASQIIQMTDSYAKFTAQLRLASTSTREYAAAYADVKQIANAAQQDLGATGMLYAQIANGTRELGTSQKKVAEITEVVNLALKVSGAAASESASAQLQLSQAFASGTLRGEEFNAVNEAAPRLMLALADGIGVPVGALKKMAEAGEITSKIMADVLPNALAKLRTEAAEVQTIAGAFTTLKNNVMEFVGVQSNASGAVSAITGAIGFLASNLTMLAGAMLTVMAVKLGNWLSGIVTDAMAAAAAKRALTAATLASAVATTEAAALAASAKLVEAQSNVRATASAAMLATARVTELRAAVLAADGAVALAIATNGLIPAQARAAALAEAHTAALAAQAVAGNVATTTAIASTAAISAQAAAATIATRAMGFLRGAMAFLGGPIGLIITLLGIGATAWALWGKKADDGAKQAKTTLADSTKEIIADLEKQIAKINERNRLQGIAPKSAKDLAQANTPAAEQMRAITAEINRIEKSTTLTGNEKIKQTNELSRLYSGLAGTVNTLAASQKKSQDLAFGKKEAEWLGKNGTSAQKMAAELADLQKEFGRVTPAMEAFVKAKYADKKSASEYASSEKAAKDFVDGLKIEASQIGLNTDQVRMMAAAREAAKAPTVGLRKQIMDEALALDIATKAVEAKAAADKVAADAQRDSDALISSINAETSGLLFKIKTYGMLPEAITRVQIAELEASKQSIGLSEKDRANIQLKIDALGKLAEAQTGTTRQAEGQKVIDDNLKAQVSMWESIDKTAHDTFVSIFDSGKSAFNRLRDTLKNGLMDLLYQMTIKKWIFNIGASVTGSAVGGAAQAAGSAAGGGSGSALGTVASAGSLLAGGASIFGAGGLAGSLAAGAGWVTGATTLGGSLAAAGSLAATGTLGGIASGLGMAVGALGPIALGLMAVVAVWKKLDTSGTSHTGGAASASSAGVSTIRAESIGFQHTKTTAEAEKFVAGLASGVVNILDSTALAFGKTAGYTAATAFADDTSKDGAWGALLIKKMGSTVLDWNSTRSSKWAPKEFGDGEAGQKQYLAALSASVRTALDSIGLPAWAKKMLDGVGAGASIEDLAKVVDQINATQRALSAMKDQLPGFKNMTEAAVSALMAASGGIEALATSAGTYFDAFMTESEKSASTIKQITEALATVGIVAPTSRDAFRALVEEQMKLGEAGASTVAMLFKVSGAFAQVYPQMEATASAAKSVADVLSERNDLQRELDELTMTQAQLLAKQRKALDPSNRALFDQIEALKAMRTAQDAAKSSMGDVISRMKSFGESARTLRDSLLMGALSVLTPEQQYAEARRQRDATRAAALGGDTAAQGNLSAMQTAFLTISQKVNGGDAQYSADFASVLQMSDEIAKWSAGQVDVAQSSLDALNAQVLGIADLNATAHLIADQLAGTPNYSAMGTENMAPLVAEIKSLREEVKGLRADQAAQTGDLIASNGAVTMDAAREVTAGVAEAATDSGWESRNAGWVNLR